MQDFRKLRVWHRAQALTVDVHRATESVSRDSVAGLRSQLRRASGSIAANIAEGAAALGPVQFARYLQIAISSASEVESHLDLAAKLEAIPHETVASLAREVEQLRRMMINLRLRVIASSANPKPRTQNPPPTT